MALDKAVSALALKVAVVAGHATAITVPGIATDDELIAVSESAVTTSAATDRTSASSISAANTVAISVDTASDKCIVLYHDSSDEDDAIDAPCIKTFVGVGAGAATGFTVTGISTEDTLLGCFEISQTDAVWTDRTSTSSITDANEVTSSTGFTNTTSDQCLTIWHDASGQGIASICPKWIQVTGHATSSTATGVAAEDTILMALNLAQTTNVVSDITSTATAAANAITWSATTANDVCLVLYHDASE